ncbi:MAG TPA: hypothetical protein VNN10_03005 [Dehalococcoidia bacterium]|nr:hypothetical protein [Dehalococcoidia bacterium]
MGDLLFGEGLLVADVLEVHLHDLEGLGAVPVHEWPGGALAASRYGRLYPVPVAAEDVADSGPGELKVLIFGEVEAEALRPKLSQVPGGKYTLFNVCRRLPGLAQRPPRSLSIY